MRRDRWSRRSGKGIFELLSVINSQIGVAEVAGGTVAKE
jgi:hypothetical protein